MRSFLIAAISASPLILSGWAIFGGAAAAQETKITGPFTHENLSVYFMHGPSAPGKVPLTLDEALARRAVEVRETGNVNELEIENLGDEEVFIQSGDIVKGGQQDRTLMVSLLLPPKSGRVPIASFCVEQGRWSARGQEDAKRFASSASSVPSREMKLAMKAPKSAAPAVGSGASRASAFADTGARQSEVWDGVRKMQSKLTGNLGAPVAAAQSRSSLQLALENEKLNEARDAYVGALRAAGSGDDDIVGYIFAVNGKLNSADVYPSNGLFRKMWNKLLDASAIEAIGQKDEARAAPPSIEAVHAFLKDAEGGKAAQRPLNAGSRLDTRDGDRAFLFETARAAAPGASVNWIHKNYLAK
jgi:hypothetical protein